MIVKTIKDVNYYWYIYIVSEKLVYDINTLQFSRQWKHKLKVVLPQWVVCWLVGSDWTTLSLKSMEELVIPKTENKVVYQIVFLPTIVVMWKWNKWKLRNDWTVNFIADYDVYNNMETSFPEK